MADQSFLVLHTLRCTGAATTGRIADAALLAHGEAESELIDHGIAGHVRSDAGAWSLTRQGKEEDARLVAAELEASGAGEVVAQAFTRFEELNEPVLRTCTDWQLRTVGGQRVRNDHTDHAWDDRVLRRLALLHSRGSAVVTTLSDALPRFSGYGVRLTRAVDRARNGDPSAVTESLDSYHTVWFQLHEDLLVTVGRPR